MNIQEQVRTAWLDIRALSSIMSALINPFGCGFVTITRGTRRGRVHDHSGKKMVDYGLLEDLEPYNSKTHGEIIDWLEEGQPIQGSNGVMKSTDGKTAIHRHVGRGNPKWNGTSGAHEYSYE